MWTLFSDVFFIPACGYSVDGLFCYSYYSPYGRDSAFVQILKRKRKLLTDCSCLRGDLSL